MLERYCFDRIGRKRNERISLFNLAELRFTKRSFFMQLTILQRIRVGALVCNSQYNFIATIHCMRNVSWGKVRAFGRT